MSDIIFPDRTVDPTKRDRTSKIYTYEELQRKYKQDILETMLAESCVVRIMEEKPGEQGEKKEKDEQKNEDGQIEYGQDLKKNDPSDPMAMIGNFRINLFYKEPNSLMKRLWVTTKPLTFLNNRYLSEYFVLTKEGTDKEEVCYLSLGAHFYFFVTRYNWYVAEHDGKMIDPGYEFEGSSYYWRFFRLKGWESPGLYHVERERDLLDPHKTLSQNGIKNGDLIYAKRIRK